MCRTSPNLLPKAHLPGGKGKLDKGRHHSAGVFFFPTFIQRGEDEGFGWEQLIAVQEALYPSRLDGVWMPAQAPVSEVAPASGLTLLNLICSSVK